jgi:ABC-type branched-subunit amino acid transport system substrate-binding protein
MMSRLPSPGRRVAPLVMVAAVALLASACGNRLTPSELANAIGATSHGATGTDATGTNGAQASGPAVGPSSGGGIPSGGGAVTPSGQGPSGNGTAAGASRAAGSAPAPASSAAPCGPDGNQTPAGGNGGATDTGVTATTITVGNIASIGGVAPGLTESAQQATQAWAAYANSQGGICGRQIKVQPFDDQSQTGNDYADSQQACSSDFAMVGNASGFDDGSAQAVNGCGIPDIAALAATTAAGAAADIFGATPGIGRYMALGPANYIKANYPNAAQHAAILYLNASDSAGLAAHQVQAYESVGFSFVYNTAVAVTQANYASNVQAMQSAGVQYVTMISDAASAERLLEAMQQANYSPQVVDWNSEEYSTQFAQQTQPQSNGNLVLLPTDAYSDAPSNPGIQLMETWLNRVAPGYTQNVFALLAWSAGLAFEQAAKAAGPNLTRQAFIHQIQLITTWTGGGVTPPINLGQKIPSKCFAYFRIENGAFQRVYPSAGNTFDCNSGIYQF